MIEEWSTPYAANVSVLANSATKLGFSCFPILLVVLIGIALLLLALALGRRKLHGHMPVGASCSMVISAACHPPETDVDAAFLHISRGEVRREEVHDGVGHCSFTSERTWPLFYGLKYA